MFGLGKKTGGTGGLSGLAMMFKPMLPMVKPMIPDLMKMMADFLPGYMEDLAKQHNIPKVIFIMDCIEENNQKVSIVKFMSVKDGKTEILLKEEGSPHVQKTSDLLEQMINIGLDAMKGNKDSDEDDE